MPETATSSEINIFADDSLLYRTINNQTDSDLLQRQLTILEDWENKYIRLTNPVPYLEEEEEEEEVVL
jgi:hypothetical protein